MIYLLTAIGLSPGGSSTVHIYTQTVHRTTQNKQYIEQHNNLGESGPCPVFASFVVIQHREETEQGQGLYRVMDIFVMYHYTRRTGAEFLFWHRDWGQHGEHTCTAETVTTTQKMHCLWGVWRCKHRRTLLRNCSLHLMWFWPCIVVNMWK